MATTTARLFIGRHEHVVGPEGIAVAGRDPMVKHGHGDDGAAVDLTANPTVPVPEHTHEAPALADLAAGKLAAQQAAADQAHREHVAERREARLERAGELASLALGPTYAAGAVWTFADDADAAGQPWDGYGTDVAALTAVIDGLTFLAVFEGYEREHFYVVRRCPRSYDPDADRAEVAHSAERYGLPLHRGDGLLTLARALNDQPPPGGGTGWWCPTCSRREYEAREEAREQAPPTAPSQFFAARAELGKFYPLAVTEAIRLAHTAAAAVEEIESEGLGGLPLAERAAFALAAATTARAMAAIADHEERRTQTYRPEE